MKKILCLLSGLGLTVTSASSSVACSIEKTGNELSDIETTAKQARLREEYISKVTKYISKYVSLNASNLYLELGATLSNKFLSVNNLISLAGTNETETETPISITSSQLSDLNKDIDKIMSFSGTLSEELESDIRENNEYSFLLTGVDSIIDSFSADTEVTLTTQKVETEQIYSASFSVNFNFNYFFNGVIESQTATVRKMVSNISGDVDLITNMRRINDELALNVYDKNKSSELFDFTKTNLSLTTGYFKDQSSKIEQEFLNTKNAQLKKAINDQINNIISGSSIEFDTLSVNTEAQMHRANVDNYMSSSDYFGEGMFKQTDKSDNDLKNDFYSKYSSSFSPSRFAAEQNKIIKSTYNIDSGKTAYTEWGSLLIGNSGSLSNSGVKLNYKDSSINLNPMSLIYIYDSEAVFEVEALKLFKLWRNAWTIGTPTQEGTAFQIPSSTTTGYAFWNIAKTNPEFPFEAVNQNRAKWYDPYVNQTVFSYFQITTSSGGRTPDVKMSSDGYSVDYSKYLENDTISSADLENSWKLIITIEEATFTIHWAHSLSEEPFINAVIYGNKYNINVIEGGSV